MLCTIGKLGWEKSALAEELAVVVKMLEDCLAEKNPNAQNPAEYQKRYNGLVVRYDTAKQWFDEVTEAIAARSVKAERLAGFIKTFEGQTAPLWDFDE